MEILISIAIFIVVLPCIAYLVNFARDRLSIDRKAQRIGEEVERRRREDGYYDRIAQNKLTSDTTQVVAAPRSPGETMSRGPLIRQIERVKAEYGAKRSDIAYVIENNALFNGDRHAETAEFDAALIAVDDVDLALVDLETLSHLADRLAIAWAAAITHAEQLGLNALEQPVTARKAAKIARKAAATSGPEKAAYEAKLAVLVDLLGVVIPSNRRAITD